MNIISSSYESESISSGIVHIGVGNFHRAHQQFYLNRLLEDKDQHQWGICGVCLLPSDKKIVQNLRAQNLEYTLTVCSSRENEVYTIASLRELIWGIEQPEAVVKKIADVSVKIITLTITEGGYNISKETGEFNLDNEAVKQDLQNRNHPKTVFGFVAEGLRRRRDANAGGITILCCDNLQHNGATARKAFLSFIRAQDAALTPWVEANVTFPNSMVDRITPSTTSDDVMRLNKASGADDKAPVYCEDFIQWVIEDDFIAGRPALERVGVEFTDDVTTYENMKLSLLNASHTLLSYPSFLMGYRKVDEAMQDGRIVKYIRAFMDTDITPYVPPPPNTDLEQYKQTLLQRFANPLVSDQISRLCGDGISKFPVYIVPSLSKMIRDGKDLARLAFLTAAYRHYLKYKVDEKGQSFTVFEPGMTPDDERLIANENELSFLNVSAFKSLQLQTTELFVSPYLMFTNDIQKRGITAALEAFIL